MELRRWNSLSVPFSDLRAKSSSVLRADLRAKSSSVLRADPRAKASSSIVGWAAAGVTVLSHSLA